MLNIGPQKYTTAYNSFVDAELQPHFDKALGKIKGSVYCVLTDINGYIETHHSKTSKEMTDNYETDVIYSRHQKMYANSETETRRAKSDAKLSADK